MTIARAALAAAFFALTLSACEAEVSVGADDMSEAELTKEVSRSVTVNEAGDTADVVCDGGLKSDEGATQTCTVTDGSGGRTGLRLEVTEVDGGDVSWSQTPYVFGDDVAAVLPDLLGQNGVTASAVTCEEDLVGKVGETIECALEGSSATTATVTVTEVDGLRVGFEAALS